MNGLPVPPLLKAAKVTGKTLTFRNAEVADAEFILSLRTDAEKSRYLSAVDNDMSAQVAWLYRYAQATDQAYFIIEHKNEPIGTVRLYDPQGNSFCWGSWILKSGCPGQAAMESALMVYAFAIDHLGFESAHFDVRKGNERVWQFHERFGAEKTSETALDLFFQLDSKAIAKSRERYQRFLPSGVNVVFK